MEMSPLSRDGLVRLRSNDRFRLRRARINLTGDFAEHFDFKIEGDFGQSDGLAPIARHSQLRTSSSTGINFRKHKSRLANGKRRSVWSSLRRTLPYCLSSAVFLPAQSLPTGKSALNFGESRLLTFGLSKRIC